MFFIKNEAFYASKNTFFEEISLAAQLSFFGQAPSSAQEKFSPAQLAQLSTIFFTAQLFFSKFATLPGIDPRI